MKRKLITYHPKLVVEFKPQEILALVWMARAHYDAELNYEALEGWIKRMQDHEAAGVFTHHLDTRKLQLLSKACAMATYLETVKERAAGVALGAHLNKILAETIAETPPAKEYEE